MKTGLVPKPASMARTAAWTPGRIDIDQDGRRPVMGDDLVRHAGRADPGDVFAELPLDRLGVLVGNQPEAELGAGLAGQHGLGAGAGVAAEDSVDVARRPGPLPLERGVAGLAVQARDTPRSAWNSASEKAAWRTRHAPSPRAA